MAKPIEVHPLAHAEMKKAHRWYRKRSVDAGAGFLVEIDRAMTAIQETPDRWAAYLFGTRRYLVHRYPYLLVYLELESSIWIVAVAHGHRRQGYWRRRLRS